MNRSLANLLTLGMLLMVAVPFWVQSRDDTYIDMLKEGTLDGSPIPTDEIQAKDALLKQDDIQLDDSQSFRQDTPARSVKVTLGQVENAAFYEVQILPYKQVWTTPMKLITPHEEPVIRLRLNPGQYQMRTRSLSEQKLPGPWGDYKSFWINFSPIMVAFPKPNSVVEAKSDKDETIAFEWPKRKDTNYYLFVLKNHERENVRIVLTRRNWIRESLKVDAQYYWAVLPVRNKSHALAMLRQPQGAPYTRFSLVKATESGRILNIKVSVNPKAEKYEFEVVKVDKHNETSEPSLYDSYSPGLALKLKPGEYEIRSRYVLDGKVPSEWSSPSSFFIARSQPRPLSPAPQSELESTDDLQSPTRFEWLADAGADRYEFFLYSTDDTLISRHETQEPWINLELPAGQTYKWHVRALSSREKPAPIERAPASATEFKINNYVKLDLGVAEESSQFYGWARQIASSSKLTGANYDINSLVNQTLYSGQTEGALGYWHRKTRMGLLGHVATSGIIINGKYHSYNNAGIHLGYRHIMDNGARLRFWVGYSYKELPEVLTHPFTTDVEVEFLKSMGPEFRVAYFMSLSQSLGLQLQASYFLGLQDLGSPNGLAQKNRYTAMASIFGTYQHDSLSKWLLGYTYNVEHGEYDTTDAIGIPNSVDLAGHYLSLMYEFGLQDRMK